VGRPCRIHGRPLRSGIRRPGWSFGGDARRAVDSSRVQRIRDCRAPRFRSVDDKRSPRHETDQRLADPTRLAGVVVIAPQRCGQGAHAIGELSIAANIARARSRLICNRPEERREGDHNSHSCQLSPTAGIAIPSRNLPATTSSIISVRRAVSSSAVSSQASQPHAGKGFDRRRTIRAAARATSARSRAAGETVPGS
jgi:hypothetical protein